MKKAALTITLLCGLITAQAQTDTLAQFSKSYTYEGTQDYTKAIEALQAVYSPGSYTVNLRMGWLWYLKGDFAKSIVHYKNAITTESRSIEARLGIVYPLAAMENWGEVIKVYQEILSIEPANSLSCYRLAYINYYIKKDYAAALQFVNRSLALYPFDYDSNYLKGLIELSMGNIVEARTATLRALQYNPASKDALKLYESLR